MPVIYLFIYLFVTDFCPVSPAFLSYPPHFATVGHSPYLLKILHLVCYCHARTIPFENARLVEFSTART